MVLAPDPRFWENVEKIPFETCWLWAGYVMPNGYGRVGRAAQGHQLAHRYAYELLVGPIPEGLTLDHLCRVRNCVNPSHLEPTTMRENTRRGNSPSMIAFRANTCRNGHPRTTENTYVYAKNGERQCRECWRIRDRGPVRRRSRLLASARLTNSEATAK